MYSRVLTFGARLFHPLLAEVLDHGVLLSLDAPQVVVQVDVVLGPRQRLVHLAKVLRDLLLDHSSLLHSGRMKRLLFGVWESLPISELLYSLFT